MRRLIRKNLPPFLAIIGLALIALGVSAYILNEQRMRFPFIEEKPFTLKAEFQTAQAVIAGQGQTVRVSGVRVGDIGKVELKDGRAVVELVLDPEFDDLVHEDATALLRPKTGLKDMFVELDPGGEDGAKLAREKFTIPIQNTLPDVNPDEIFAALDADTRSYLQLLIDGAGRGLKGRGSDLQDVLSRFEPTFRDLARVQSAVATRKRNLRRLVTSLRGLSEELASKDSDIAQLIDTSATTFRAFASEEANLSQAVRNLPGALAQTTETLGKVEAFANVLRPTADRLRPAVRRIDDANAELVPLAREATPLLRRDIRPFVREARPLVRSLKPAAHDLVTAEPKLTRSVDSLNKLFNLLAYNPRGREDPADRQREEGYLFHFAWLAHTSLALFSGSDAHGVFRPLTIGGTCNILRSTVATVPALEQILGLTGVLTDPRVCGGQIPPGTPRSKSKGAKSR